MRIFAMECLKMCVVVGLALTAVPGRPVAAAPSRTNDYVFQQHKRSPADPNLDLTSALTTDFGGFGTSATLPDFSYGSSFSSNAAGFGLDDATDGFGTSAGLLHLSHPYSTATFGSGFNSIGYPFSESTLNQLQFKGSLVSGSSPSLPVSIKYSPSVSNADLYRTRITGLSNTESVKPTAQRTVLLPNEQRVPVESLNAAPAPLQQSYPASASVPQRQSYPTAVFIPRQQSYVTPISAPLQQSYPATASASLQTYPASTYVPQQQLYPATISAPLQQSYPASTSALFQQSYVSAESVPQQQSYPDAQSVPQQQSYPAAQSVPQQQSFPTAQSVPQQQSFPTAQSVPQQQSVSPSGSIQQQQSYQTSGSVPQQQSYPAAQSVPQQQLYPTAQSVPQQQPYQTSGSTPLQQSYSAAEYVPQQQSYQAALSAPFQQSYAAATSTPPQQSYPATAEDLRISAYQPPAASGSVSIAGSTPDLILELRPPPIDYRQNVNIPSTPSSSYPPADSNNNNNNYPGNAFGLSTALVAGTSGSNQISNGPNGGQLPGNTNDFLAVGSNAKPDQTPSNTYYTVPLPVSGSSNSASSDVPNYFSIPSISYSLTSTVNGEFAGSKSVPPATPVPSFGTDRGVPAVANPTGSPSSSYRDTNSIPRVSFTNSNSISANSYSDSNSIQSSSYTIPSSTVSGNSYSDYKLSTDNFFGDSNSISTNSKRESSTVNQSKKFPRLS